MGDDIVYSAERSVAVHQRTGMELASHVEYIGTGQETPKLEVSSEEALVMATSLKSVFYETHLLLELLESEYLGLLNEATLSDSTEEKSGSDQTMLH
jgi:hypothetical protein